MKTYISDLIPKLKRYSQKLDNLTLLTNQHWVMIDDVTNVKSVYIFRDNNQLLISLNGKVEKAKWEYLGHNSILIDRKEDSYLFKHGFFDENILALKIDSRNEYVFLVNETRYNIEINTIDSVNHFLSQKYLNTKEDEKDAIVKSSDSDLDYENLKNWNVDEGKLTVIPIISKKKEGLVKAFLNDKPAPKNRYVLGFCYYLIVKYDGIGYYTSSPF